MLFDWKGNRIVAEVLTAARREVHETAQVAVEYAKSHHTWRSETGELEDSIGIESEDVRGLEAIAVWGSDDPAAFHVETGTHDMRAEPFLRPAQDDAIAHEARQGRLRADYEEVRRATGRIG